MNSVSTMGPGLTSGPPGGPGSLPVLGAQGSQEQLVRGCLQKTRGSSERRDTLNKQVSFPEDESRLVTGFMEAPNPWECAEDVDHAELISAYQESCRRHGHSPSSSVLKQLEAMDLNGDRCNNLDLKGEFLDAPHCESLEEILKRVQFNTLNLENTSLDDEGAAALFDMIEYYESANHINISSNQNITVRGWQACSRMLKKTQSLEQLEARSMVFSDQIMPILCRALRITTQLQVLKLENCKLNTNRLVILVAALKLNTSLRELCLADNDLNSNDATHLGTLLRSNTTLQLLDVSNNNIEDDGAGHITDALCEQAPSGPGLSILVLWNNRLTKDSSPHFAKALTRCHSLEMLNIGRNVLSNEVLHVIKDSLQQNRCLLRLGMQSTHMSCEGAIALAEVIEDNRIIQRIDLRDNNILVAGLMALALSMKSNQSVTQLDLDDTPKKKFPADVSVDEYRRLVSEIRRFCERNEELASQNAEEDDEEEASETSDTERERCDRDRRIRLSSINSRKISLTCQTLLRTVGQDSGNPGSGGLLVEPRRTGGRLRSPAPSPVPSPVSSPMPSPAPSPGPARSRFRVSQVSESDSLSPSPSASPSTSPTCFFPSSSRFRVTVVEPSANVLPPNSVTMGFSYRQQSSSSSDKESVTPDTDSEVRSIMSGIQGSLSLNTSPKRQPHTPPQYQSSPPQPQSQQQSRSRKISWVPMGISSVSLSSDENKAPSSLERLFGLFQNPGSLFNKIPGSPPSQHQQTPKRSPQSSPQQTRSTTPLRTQLPENGTSSPKKFPIPLLHPDIITNSTPCSSDFSGLGNGGGASSVLKHETNSDPVIECDTQEKKDILNNNQEVAEAGDKPERLEIRADASARKDENLNIRKPGGMVDVNCGQGDDVSATSDSTAVIISGASSSPTPSPAHSSHLTISSALSAEISSLAPDDSVPAADMEIAGAGACEAPSFSSTEGKDTNS